MNKYLSDRTYTGLKMGVREARLALDRLEAAIETEHPGRVRDFVNDVSGCMAHALAFCEGESARIDCALQRSTKACRYCNGTGSNAASLDEDCGGCNGSGRDSDCRGSRNG